MTTVMDAKKSLETVSGYDLLKGYPVETKGDAVRPKGEKSVRMKILSLNIKSK